MINCVSKVSTFFKNAFKVAQKTKGITYEEALKVAKKNPATYTWADCHSKKGWHTIRRMIKGPNPCEYTYRAQAFDAKGRLRRTYREVDDSYTMFLDSRNGKFSMFFPLRKQAVPGIPDAYRFADIKVKTKVDNINDLRTFYQQHISTYA